MVWNVISITFTFKSTEDNKTRYVVWMFLLYVRDNVTRYVMQNVVILTPLFSKHKIYYVGYWVPINGIYMKGKMKK